MTRLLLALALGAVTFAAGAGDRITGKPFATRSEVLATHGMVATSVPLDTQIGLDILKKGGTAVDAAIAANAALGLMEPVSNGVGGDLFAIVWDAKTKKLYGYNGSGRSPKSLPLQYFVDHGIKEIPALGPLAVLAAARGAALAGRRRDRRRRAAQAVRGPARRSDGRARRT
jgi:gamma-glutamyltranspeptidase/glutathione hydrolase